MWPTAAARTSYLVSEQADCLLRGTPAGWLGPASENFAEFVAVRRGARARLAEADSARLACEW